ncbi:SAM-dependent methyltransferase [Hoeflea sp.]|uniref:SAM-dependent methyltransferase n=1 Tax=Hoeflea sp. TaxID=1940281 RepID=UPI003B52E2D7
MSAKLSPDDQARAIVAELKDVPRGGVAAVPAIVPAASDLAAIIERARALLDDGDVAAARLLADRAYGDAKLAARAAERLTASRGLVGKALQLQADALLIEARARIRIADEWDAAQASGEISRGGRPKIADGKPVPAGNGFTAADTGLTRKEISEARKLRDAERRTPGIAERAIAARLAEGLAPTKANLRAAVGTSSATKEERGDNLYETPIEAMRTLLALEAFGPLVLEPSCGKGAISRPLEAAGHDVILTDLVDYGTSDRHGVCQHVGDFREAKRAELTDATVIDLVGNPPYGEAMNAFIAHALREFRPGKMAMLLNLNAICGTEDADRNFWLDEWPPSCIWVFSRRLPMMHRDGWDGPIASSRMNTAWFVWERVWGDSERPYGDGAKIRRVDWKDFEDRAALGVMGS